MKAENLVTLEDIARRHEVVILDNSGLPYFGVGGTNDLDKLRFVREDFSMILGILNNRRNMFITKEEKSKFEISLTKINSVRGYFKKKKEELKRVMKGSRGKKNSYFDEIYLVLKNIQKNMLSFSEKVLNLESNRDIYDLLSPIVDAAAEHSFEKGDINPNRKNYEGDKNTVSNAYSLALNEGKDVCIVTGTHDIVRMSDMAGRFLSMGGFNSKVLDALMDFPMNIYCEYPNSRYSFSCKTFRLRSRGCDDLSDQGAMERLRNIVDKISDLTVSRSLIGDTPDLTREAYQDFLANEQRE